jgi:hypothetical protein
MCAIQVIPAMTAVDAQAILATMLMGVQCVLIHPLVEFQIFAQKDFVIPF